MGNASLDDLDWVACNLSQKDPDIKTIRLLLPPAFLPAYPTLPQLLGRSEGSILAHSMFKFWACGATELVLVAGGSGK